MKEATGELNMSVFVIISIGILSTFFYTVIWPGIRSNMNKNIQCNKAIECVDQGNGTATCNYYEKDNHGVTILIEAGITCPWKG